ncbi:MAG TPA: enoyl-CoA hydratase/isomerase family protein [Candidatus Dormibacteraeota bacterium]|nr:enoyl-CoA hydratase/isomerase family protein [Candidatus Dormibacteraeota bacterium]
MAGGLEIRQDDEVVVVTLDRPPDNAFTVDMCRTLSELLESPPAGARLIRLRGSHGVFCRGRDRSANGTEAALATVDALASATRGLSETSLVTVAEVDGDAAGFGVGLVAQCDVSVATSGSRFWFPEVTHGLAPALVLSWLPRVVGRRDAFWLTATGGQLMAVDAQRIGLLNFVEASDGLATRVNAVIASLLQYSAEVHAEIKRDLRDFDEVGQAAAYRMARDRLLLASVTDGT